MKKAVIALAIFVIFNVLQTSSVHADAWWGKGHRTPAWVIANGGTLIYFKVVGTKKKPLVKLFTAGGHALERETGSSGVFDDALAGTQYYLRAQGDGKFKSQVFTLRAGSTNHATIDYKKKKISMVFGTPRRRIVSQKQKSKEDLGKAEMISRPYQMSFVLEDEFLKYPLMSRPKLPVYWEDDVLTLYWFPREH